MTKKELTCVVCPAGCRISVILDDAGNITEITGHTCPRGKSYAQTEITHPVRTLTTTVVLEGAKSGACVLPVKTSRPLSKDLLFHAMRALTGFSTAAPVAVGQILLKDFMEPGVDLIACKTIE